MIVYRSHFRAPFICTQNPVGKTLVDQQRLQRLLADQRYCAGAKLSKGEKKPDELDFITQALFLPDKQRFACQGLAVPVWREWMRFVSRRRGEILVSWPESPAGLIGWPAFRVASMAKQQQRKIPACITVIQVER
jgi:hypothetical protein